jgi:hypothetical protein
MLGQLIISLNLSLEVSFEAPLEAFLTLVELLGDCSIE